MSRQRGSHRQFKHPIRSGLGTVPGHPGDEMNSKTRGGTVLPQAAMHVVEVPEGGAAEWIEVELPVREVISA